MKYLVVICVTVLAIAALKYFEAYAEKMADVYVVMHAMNAHEAAPLERF